jgi:hypothetical protein
LIKKILSQVKLSLGFCTLSLASSILLGTYYFSLNHKTTDLTHRLARAHSLAARAKEAATVLQNHQEIYTAFTQCQFEETLTLEKLRSLISHPFEYGQASFLKNGMVSQDITFSVSGLQDGDVFALIDRLATKGPGVFQIREVSITRIKPLNEDILQEIAAGQPQSLIEGHVVTTWIHR